MNINFFGKKDNTTKENTQKDKENSINISFEPFRIKTENKSQFLKKSENVQALKETLVLKAIFNKSNFNNDDELRNFFKTLLKNYDGQININDKSKNLVLKYGFELETILKEFLK